MGIPVPDTIRVYGMVLREPGQFSKGLSPAPAVQSSNFASVAAGKAGPRGRPHREFFGKPNPQEEKHSWKKTL